MLYTKDVQEARAAGYSLEDIKSLAVRQYNEAIEAGYDRADARKYLKSIYGLTTGTTQEDLDDAHFLAALMFSPLEDETKETEKSSNAATSAKPVSNWSDAIQAGYQNSIVGLALRGEAPSLAITADSSTPEKVISAIAQGIGDLPATIMGGVFGGAAGTAAGTAVAGPGGAVAGGAVGSMAGMGFVPEYIRSALIKEYNSGRALNWADFTSRTVDNFIAGGKGALIGMAAGAAGQAVAPVAAKVAASKFVNPYMSTAASGGVTLAAEATAMTTAMAALDNRIPTADDFLTAGLTLGSMKLGGLYTDKAVTKMGVAARESYKRGYRSSSEFKNICTDIYLQKFQDEFISTGRTPEDISTSFLIDPTVKERVAAVNQKITAAEEETSYYRAHVVLSDKDVVARGLDKPEAAGKKYSEVELAERAASDSVDFTPDEYAGQWVYASRTRAEAIAKEVAEKKFEAGGQPTKVVSPAIFTKEIGIAKKGLYIHFRLNSDSLMTKIVREYMKTDEGQAELIAKDPNFFQENPNWFKEFETKADERIVSTARSLFEAPTDSFIEFLRSHPWSDDMAKSMAQIPGMLDNFVSGAPIPWAGIIQNTPKGVRYYVFNPAKMQHSTRTVTGKTPYDQASAKMGEILSIGEKPSRTWQERIDNLTYHVIDSFAALNTAARKGLRSEAYVEAIVSNGAAGRASFMLDYGMIDYKGNTVGKGLKDILKQVTDNGGDMVEFSKYLAARNFRDLNNRGINTALDADSTLSILKGPQAKIYEPIANEVKAFNDGLLNYQLEAGLISKSRYDALRRDFKNSVPLDKLVEAFEPELQGEAVRVSESAIMGKGEANTLTDKIARAFGMKKESDGKLYIDPVESMIRATFLTTRLAAQNRAKRAAAETYGVRIDSPGAKAPNMTTITYYQNGKARRMAVPKEIREATLAMDAGTFQMYNVAMQRLAQATGFFRIGTTMTPAFAMKSFFIDQLSAWIQSPKDVSYCPYVSALKGLAEIVKTKRTGKESLYTDWLKDGGSQASIVSLGRNFTQETIREVQTQSVQNLIKDPVKNYKELVQLVSPTSLLKKTYKVLEGFTEYADQATRVGMYMEARKAGYSGKESAYLSRMSTVDFARAGATTKALNSIIAFLNARVQGMSRIYETVKDDPRAFMSKVVQGVIIPSMLLEMVKQDIMQSNQNPEDPQYSLAETLRQAPDWQTTAYWLIPVPAINSVMRIPKPHELAVPFAAPVESLVSYMYKHGTPDGLSYLEQLEENGIFNGIYDTMLPNVIPTPFIPPIELIGNKSFFTKTNVIPAHLENQVPAMQYKPGTSTSAKWLSSMLFKIDPQASSNAATRFISPIGIDHLVRGWTGSIGTSIVSALDKMLEVSGVYDGPVKPAKSIEDYPFFKTFMVKYPSLGAKDIMKFNEEANTMQQRWNSIKAGYKSSDPHAIAVAETLAHSVAYANMQPIRASLSKMSKTAQMIAMHPEWDSEYKQQRLEEIYIQMTQVAKEGRKLIKRITREVEDASR